MNGSSPLMNNFPKNARSWVLCFFKHIGVVMLYCGLAGGFGLEMAILDKTAPLIWPPSGLAIAIVLLFGYRYLGAFAVGAVITDYWQGSGWIYSLISATSFSLSIAAAAFTLRKLLRFNNALERLKDVLGFIFFAALLSTLIHASITTGVLIWQQPELKPDFNRIWSIRWLGQCLGMVILGPFLMVWYSRTRINFSNRQLVEVFLWLGTLIFIGILVFSNWAPTDTLRYPLELAIFPLLAWAGIRYGQRGATTGIFILAIMAFWELKDVVGPYATKIHSQPPVYLWVFLGVLSLTGLSLASILTEYKIREESIWQNERRLRAFLDAMPDVAFIISAGGRFLEVFASQSSSYFHQVEEAQEIKGKTYFDIYSPEIAERFHRAVLNTIQTGRLQVIEYALPYEGRDYWFEGRLAPMAPDEESPEKSVIWMAYDITQRKEALKSIEARDKLLGGVAKAKTNLLTIKDFNHAIGSAIDNLGKSAGVDQVYVFENHHDPDNGSYSLALRFRWPGKGADEGDADSLWQGISYDKQLPGWYKTLSEAGTIQGLGGDFSKDIRQLFSWPDEVSALFVPIVRESEFWGVIGLASFHQPHKWQESEVAVLTAVAASIGGFIESKRNEVELIKAKNMADSASLAKGEFLAMMSHEIRTPMNAILGFADLLSQTEIKPDQEEYLQIINRSGRALLELINNILDFSKIESRAIELEEAPFRLEDAVLEALELVNVKAREKNIELAYNLKDDSSGFFNGDFHRLRQILLNLVNNAVKFTNEGEVSIEITTRNLQGLQWEIHFAVKDSGIGIPQDRVERLFLPFSQVDSSTTRQFGGTGLGLVICKRICEKMGGKIWVESQAESGSTFHFTVVVTKAREDRKTAEIPMDRLDDQYFSKEYPLKIMVAEDDSVNQKLMLEILSKLGFRADLASSNLDVMEKIRVGRYEVLLLDLRIPGMNGWEITRRIRSGEGGIDRRNTYIIAVTAFALKEDREKCLAEGINDHIPKPVVLAELKSALARAHASINQS